MSRILGGMYIKENHNPTHLGNESNKNQPKSRQEIVNENRLCNEDLSKIEDLLQDKEQDVFQDVEHDTEQAMEEDIDSGDEKQAKIRRHLSVCYDKVFESALAILPTSGFIKVVKQLLGRDQPANIQRKALEVLNARFGQKELANPNIPAILQCLARLAMTENKESSNVDNKGKDLTPWID